MTRTRVTGTPEKRAASRFEPMRVQVAAEARGVQEDAEQDREPEQDEQRDRQLGVGCSRRRSS